MPGIDFSISAVCPTPISKYTREKIRFPSDLLWLFNLDANPDLDYTSRFVEQGNGEIESSN